MHKHRIFAVALFFIAGSTLFYYTADTGTSYVAGNGNYSDLVNLFNEFREFQQPTVIDGVPDYSAATMEKQYRELKTYQNRLAAIFPNGWPVSEQVDYHMARAEMNALGFYHRVLKPWSRFPTFYLRTRMGTGSTIYDKLPVGDATVPENEIDEIVSMLTSVPKIFKQATNNLVEAIGDNAELAIRWSESEIEYYDGIVSMLSENRPDLVPAAERARNAVVIYRDWLIENKDAMTIHSGVGKENYNWWMKNVLLFPYAWDELLVLAEREYDRAYSVLKLTEHRNRDLPELVAVASEVEYKQRWSEFEEHISRFLRKNDIFTVPDYLKPVGAGTWWNAPGGIGQQEFFLKCADLNPLSEISHGLTGHTFFWERHERDDRPIRGAYPQLRMEMIIDEGLAYALEELLLNAGLYDDFPQGKEITYIAQVFRAIRMITDLKIHSNEFTLEDATRYYAEKTPYGWAFEESYNTLHDIDMSIINPGYAMAYVGGKFQIDGLLADQAHKLGMDFNLKDFMDEFFSMGAVPFALLRWEMTGFDDEVKKLW
jgi:hypothetical protein